jgi:hypothetical protein
LEGSGFFLMRRNEIWSRALCFFFIFVD